LFFFFANKRRIIKLMMQNPTTQSVSLYSLVRNLLWRASSDFRTIGEQLKSETNERKKQLLHEYFIKTREQFVRLLVLIRWSKKISAIDQCKNVISSLQGQTSAFEQSANALFFADRIIKVAR